MKKIILLAFVAACILSACDQKPKVDIAKEEQSLRATDHDFCALERSEGLGKAIAKYYADDVVGISPDQPVGIGKGPLSKLISESQMDAVKALEWAAERVEVSSSGDLGYVWGRYHMSAKTEQGTDTTYYGAYCTVYKKQADGSWKVVLDQNNNTPKP